jgi:CheY-like chemotaxis protein
MSPKHVLVVEDDPGVRAFCVDALQGLGYAVVAVDDGSLALHEIPRFQPDLILLDLIMPRAKLDGIGLLSTLVAGPDCSIPVIILSAFGDALAQEISPDVSGALHIEAILSKPVSLDTLAQEVDRLVGPAVNG